MPVRFLDTNILIRLLTRDDEEKAALAHAMLRRVEEGDEIVETSPMVIFEAVFILEKSYRLAKTTIRENISNLLSLRGMRIAGKALYSQALDLYVDKNISFADAYNAAFMQSAGLTEIYTWDTDFDRMEGITRVEPSA
jgi:predicted nucleic acid-binding protein